MKRLPASVECARKQSEIRHSHTSAEIFWRLPRQHESFPSHVCSTVLASKISVLRNRFVCNTGNHCTAGCACSSSNVACAPRCVRRSFRRDHGAHAGRCPGLPELPRKPLVPLTRGIATAEGNARAWGRCLGSLNPSMKLISTIRARSRDSGDARAYAEMPW